MRLKFRWWLFGALAYLGWLLITFPIGPVVATLAAAGVPVQLQGSTGSLWRGEADRVHVPTAGLSFANVQWHFSPGGLLRGRPGFAVSFKDAGDAVIARVGVSPSGLVHVDDVSGKIAAMRFVPLLPMALGLEGALVLDEVSVTLDAGRPAAASGTARWVGARIVSPFTLDLGLVSLELFETEAGWSGDYTGQGAAGELSGSIEAGRDGHYRTDTVITARDANVASFLAGMGYEPANGDYRLVYDGVF